MRCLILIAIFPWVFTSCSKSEPETQEDSLRKKIVAYFAKNTEDDIRPFLFLPDELTKEQEARILRERVAVHEHVKTPIEIKELHIKGRWAMFTLAKPNLHIKHHYALKVDSEWTMFWDPTFSFMWGKQDWHKMVSEEDWNDWKTLTSSR